MEIVGRAEELARVHGLVDAARAGSTGCLVLTGEPGIGKTTLLEAAARAATGFRCLWVHGTESEAVLDHAGLLEALTPVRELLTELPDAQAGALRSALGWGSAAAPAERFLVAAATLSVLAAAAERSPVLVLVDDVQWLDRDSAAALAFAARRLRDDPVCFLWAGRDGAAPDGLPVLSLSGLTGGEARTLVAVAPAVADRLAADTGGNPLAMLEVARRLTDAQRVGAAGLPEPLPVGDRLGTVYADLLAGLSAPSRRAVLLLALNRSGTAAAVAAALTGEGHDADAAIDEARDSGVLVADGGQPAFRHPLLRTATLALATSAEQRSAHRSLAGVLAGELAGVWHRAEAAAGPDDELADDLARVAAMSRTRQGYAAASAALERAALLTGSAAGAADRLAAAAADAFLAGDVERTRALAGRVLDGTAARGQALFTLGMLEQYAGSVPRAVELLAAAAESLTGGHRVRALAELATARFRLNDLAGVGDCAELIGAVADPGDAEQRLLADFVRGIAAVLAGRPAEGAELLTAVIDRIVGPGGGDDPRSILVLALAAGFAGDPRTAMAQGAHRLDEVRERGAWGVLVPTLAIVAAGRAWLGDQVGAYADAGEAAELGDQLGYAADAAIAVEMLAWQYAARGLHDEARAALRRAGVLTDRAGTTEFAAHLAVTAAFCALCRADPADAVALLEKRLAADGGVGSQGEPLGIAPGLVEAYLALGRQADAAELAGRFAAVTPPAAAPWLRALVLRCQGLAADRDETALAAFEAALAAHAEAPEVFEAARTRLLYGARLRRAGRRVQAREQLRGAHQEFVRMDLSAWADRAAGELAATGATARSRQPRASEPLTSQETRVALQAAKGRSNREIAAALFLSPKTVEHHLSSVYRKRGFRSRAELAASFARG